MVAALALGGPAIALWSDTASTGQITMTRGVMALKVTSPALTSSSGQWSATGNAGEKATFELKAADYTAMMKPGGIAIPITIEARADGNMGMTYGLNPAAAPAGSIIAASRTALFPVATAQDCTVGTSGQGGSGTGAPPAWSGRIDPTYTATPDVTTTTLCLTAAWDRSKTGQYSNTATVTAGDGQGSTVTATDTWNAVVLPDPSSQPTWAMTLTYQAIRLTP
jgi:hypothetical protein